MLIAPLGLAVGVVLGALGGGGAILLTPVLVYLLGMSAGQASTTALVVVGLSALVGAFQQARLGNVRIADGLTFALWGTLGSWSGSRLAVRLPSDILLTAFSALLLVVAAVMVRRARATGQDDSQSQTAGPRPWPTRLLVATGVGFLAGLFGVGGGFVVVPALTLLLGLPMPIAVGTSLVVIAANSAVALEFRLAAGLHVYWPTTLLLAGFAVVGSLLGARIGQRLGPTRMTHGFVVLLIVVAALLAAQNIPSLIHP